MCAILLFTSVNFDRHRKITTFKVSVAVGIGFLGSLNGHCPSVVVHLKRRTRLNPVSCSPGWATILNSGYNVTKMNRSATKKTILARMWNLHKRFVKKLVFRWNWTAVCLSYTWYDSSYTMTASVSATRLLTLPIFVWKKYESDSGYAFSAISPASIFAIDNRKKGGWSCHELNAW